ncbi:MAG: DUF3379 domain-containing protein [Steroidobacteraceae bacterium]|jgi:hypothetical protein|nr:DUF3379 domain-containing protein [Steroidobacteraceae bacterium]
MKCEEARLQIGADPAGRSAELEVHVTGCADCSGYRREMQRLEGDLRRALDWPRGETVGGGFPARDAPVPAPAAPQTRASAEGAPVPAARRWAFAAGVLLVGVLAASFLALQPRDALAAQLVEHMAEEPDAWDARRPIPQSALDLVLRRSGVRLDRLAAGEVVYAHSCYLRGRQVPHLVVATARGPVTVLVLPGERVTRRQAFDEGGYRGSLWPAPAVQGGIAVLERGAGEPSGPDLDAVARQVLAALGE